MKSRPFLNYPNEVEWLSFLCSFALLSHLSHSHLSPIPKIQIFKIYLTLFIPNKELKEKKCLAPGTILLTHPSLHPPINASSPYAFQPIPNSPNPFFPPPPPNPIFPFSVFVYPPSISVKVPPLLLPFSSFLPFPLPLCPSLFGLSYPIIVQSLGGGLGMSERHHL